MVFNPELMFSLLKVQQIEYYVKEISLPYTENLSQKQVSEQFQRNSAQVYKCRNYPK